MIVDLLIQIRIANALAPQLVRLSRWILPPHHTTHGTLVVVEDMDHLR
jgi:hypothetical protein